MKRFIPFVFALLAFAFALNAQPTEPILRIETGMHTAIIRRIGTDAANRFLLTASEDKTARLWDLSDGKLLQVFRPPIGEGSEGKLFSAAISPNGSLIALGGFTGASGQEKSIYIFDRASGKLLRRLSGFPDVICHLIFSPDGKFLSASLGSNGVRLYETTNWQNIGSDTDYGSSSYGADFDKSSTQLTTSSFDGYLRIYAIEANGLRLIGKRITPGGKNPFSVRFAPDGTKIAVGFMDSTAVNIFSATDLSFLFAPDTVGINNGNLSSVIWSHDGNTLSAGGTYQISGDKQIRNWENRGRGSYRETTASLDVIMDTQSLQSGGLVYGAGDPSWGIIDGNKRSKLVVSEIADYRSMQENFKVSDDGAEINFAYEVLGKLLKVFSLTDKTLSDKGSGKNLSSPKINSLNITDWQDNREPKINGKKLFLKQYEMSRSLAIDRDNQKFLLGSDWTLRLLDRNGAELWDTSAPAAAWAVNISGNGKLAIAAFGDGTIRWYRLTDGKELLAFFPHKDQKRWVMWTASGYYDASPGAEDLIGWHVNNGKDAAADFFPVGLFRNRFYRPDIVSNILYTLDESIAVRIANEESGRKEQRAEIAKQLPPVVEIISPNSGTEVSDNQITIRYNVRSNEPVTNVKALIDGRPNERGVGIVSANNSQITVTIPERDCEVSLIAENRFAPSVPVTIRLKWKGKTPAISVNDLKPKLYILAVGVSKYAKPEFNLGLPSKDANDFVNVMMKQKGLLYRDVEIKLLTDSEATKENILDGLEWITKQTTSRDVAMVFIAGHGINDTLNRYYFAPHNFDMDKILRTGLIFSDIKNAVEAIYGKALFFIDTCHSGNSIGTTKSRDGAVDINGMVNELSSAENGAIVFNASTGRQVSLEDPAWNNGAFTKALIEGLGGKAASDKGKITVKSLDFYISERVKQLTGGRQTPTTVIPTTVSDFPIAARQ